MVTISIHRSSKAIFGAYKCGYFLGHQLKLKVLFLETVLLITHNIYFWLINEKINQFLITQTVLEASVSTLYVSSKKSVKQQIA